MKEVAGHVNAWILNGQMSASREGLTMHAALTGLMFDEGGGCTDEVC